jgi:hypothetical protein
MPPVTGTADATAPYGVKGENPSQPPSGPPFPVIIGGPPVTGVWGDSSSYTGVTGTSDQGVGVWGGSKLGNRVLIGVEYDRYGFLGGSDPLYSQDAGACGVSGQQGVFGHSTGSDGTGVYGNGFYAVRGDSPNGKGFLGGIDPQYSQKAGVYGSSDQQGVVGASTGGHGTAVYGDSTDGFAVRGETTTGTAIQGTASNGGYAAQFNGNVAVTNGNITVTGDVTGGVLVSNGDATVTGTLTTHDVVLSNSDCAEDFDIADTEGAEPGTVMVLDDSGNLHPNDAAYDKRVVGVISGAGRFKPGITLGRLPSEGKRMPIALLGKVYCKVDGDYGRVEVGDLLTTSPTRGHAMKATNPDQAFGSIIGKALQSLACGQGLIPILVVLQ